jgi:hypothetical protein
MALGLAPCSLRRLLAARQVAFCQARSFERISLDVSLIASLWRLDAPKRPTSLNSEQLFGGLKGVPLALRASR